MLTGPRLPVGRPHPRAAGSAARRQTGRWMKLLGCCGAGRKSPGASRTTSRTGPGAQRGTGSRRRCRGAGGCDLGMKLARFPGGSTEEPSRDQCFARSRTQSRCRVHAQMKVDGPYDALERDTRTRRRVRTHTRRRVRVAEIARVLHGFWESYHIIETRCEPAVARNTEALLVQVSCSCATLHPSWSPERQQRRRSRGGDDVELQRPETSEDSELLPT